MSEKKPRIQLANIVALVAPPLFLGVAPIFGKMAIHAGADPFTLSALRTLVAVGLMWFFYAIFARRYIYIYPAGLMGCVVIGAINGIGSLFYYSGLGHLDASMVQLINGSYLAFAVLLSFIGGQKPNARVLFRVLLAMGALMMITGLAQRQVDWTGVGLMLGNALMFAGTVILSQYVLYEMPAPTAALYILSTMGIVVTMAWLAVAPPLDAEVLSNAFVPIVLLGITTALSRLAIFASVKFLGGVQTAVNAAGEIAVALVLAFIFLGDSLTEWQWIGTAMMFGSILLIRPNDLLPHGFNPNALIVANMASVQFQRIAFHRAFGTQEHDNEHSTMQSLTTDEMKAIMRMMGAELGAIDPFPITKSQHIIGTLNEAESETNTRPMRPPEEDVALAQTQPVQVNKALHELRIPPELRDKDSP